jgi:hypothetical protein
MQKNLVVPFLLGLFFDPEDGGDIFLQIETVDLQLTTPRHIPSP